MTITQGDLMKMSTNTILALFWLLPAGSAVAQPGRESVRENAGGDFTEAFDSISPPALPPGWNSSQARSQGTNDFATSAGTAHSSPNAVLATNATIAQELLSPSLDFSGTIPDLLEFYTRRSSSFRAIVVVEASFDGGDTFTVPVGDSLRATASTG